MISLIISFYKRIDFLNLVLQGVERQSYKNFEVIISEDNNAEETIAFLEEARKRYSFPIKHVSHEDIGFRKTRILNAALLAAEGEKLVFLDNDCIPHKHFLKEYTKAISNNMICYGRRAYLSDKITNRLLQEKSITNLSFFNAGVAGSKCMRSAIYLPFWFNINKQHRAILGCNWGVLRQHLLDINGFDEDYTRAGAGEDLDIEWRLKSKGLQMKSMKNKAIVYHLHHASNYNDADTIATHSLMAEKQKMNIVYCLNGINKE